MSCLELRFVNFLLNEYCIVLYCISNYVDRDQRDTTKPDHQHEHCTSAKSRCSEVAVSVFQYI